MNILNIEFLKSRSLYFSIYILFQFNFVKVKKTDTNSNHLKNKNLTDSKKNEINKKKINSNHHNKKIKLYYNKIKKIQKQILNNKNKKIVKKDGNHVFGLKKLKNTAKINLKSLNQILEIDTNNETVTVESSVTIKTVI